MDGPWRFSSRAKDMALTGGRVGDFWDPHLQANTQFTRVTTLTAYAPWFNILWLILVNEFSNMLIELNTAPMIKVGLKSVVL